MILLKQLVCKKWKRSWQVNRQPNPPSVPKKQWFSKTHIKGKPMVNQPLMTDVASLFIDQVPVDWFGKPF